MDRSLTGGFATYDAVVDYGKTEHSIPNHCEALVAMLPGIFPRGRAVRPVCSESFFEEFGIPKVILKNVFHRFLRHTSVNYESLFRLVFFFLLFILKFF